MFDEYFEVYPDACFEAVAEEEKWLPYTHDEAKRYEHSGQYAVEPEVVAEQQGKADIDGSLGYRRPDVLIEAVSIYVEIDSASEE